MALIPTYTRQNVPSGIPQTAQTPVAPIGGALQAIAGGARDAAQGMAYAEAVKRQKDEEDAAAWASKELATAKLAWTQKSIGAQENAAPGAYGFTGQITEEYDAYVDDLLAKAPSDGARRYIELRLTDFKADLVGDAMRFEAGARLAKRIDDTRGAINTNRNIVSTDPTQFEAVLGDQVASITALDIPDAKKQMLLEEAQRGLAFSAVQGSIAKAPATTLAELQAGDWDHLLDADNKAQLINQAEADVRRLEAERKAAQAEFAANYALDVQDYTAQLASGFGQVDPDFSPAKIRAIVPGARGERMARSVEVASATGVMRTEIATATPVELAQMAADLKGELGGDLAGFRDRAQQYEIFTQLVAARTREVAADPAGYAAANFSNVKSAGAELFAAMGDPQATPAQRRAAAQRYSVAQAAAQSSLGVDAAEQRLLTATMAAGVVSQFGGPNAKGDQALSTAQAYADAFGDQWPRLAREIGKDLPAHVNTIIAMDDPAQANDRAFVAAANEAATEIKKSLAGQVKDSDVATAVDGALAAARASIAAAGAGGEATYAQLYATTLATANALIAQGRDVDEAAEAAAGMTFDKKYNTAGALRFPKRFDPGEISAGAEAAIDIVGSQQLDPPPSLSGLAEADARAAYANAVRDRGTWLTKPDESGAMLVDEFGWPVTVGGKPVELDWAALAARGAEPRPWRPVPDWMGQPEMMAP